MLSIAAFLTHILGHQACFLYMGNFDFFPKLDFKIIKIKIVSQLVKNPSAMQETPVWSLGWKDPLVEGMATHSSIPAWRIPMNKGAWQATVHGIAESDMTEWLTTFKPFMGHHWLNEWLYFSPHYFFRITSFLENEIVTHKTNLPIVINRMSFYLPRYIKR